MIDSVGTFQRSGLSKEDVQSRLSDKCAIGNIKRVTEIENGVNASAVLQTENAEKYFVKFNTFNPTINFFYVQPFVLSYLNSNERGVNVPSPVGYDYTRDEFNYDWYMTEFVDGEELETEEKPLTVENSRLVGKTLGRINSISVNGVGYPNPKTETGKSCSIEPYLSFDNDSWEEYMKRELYKLVNTSDTRFASLRNDIREFIENCAIREVNPQLIHFDYWSENIIWENNTPYVIDWERSVGGDPMANRIQSEHYLFDKIAPYSDEFSDDEYIQNRDKMIDEFRNAYTSAYTGEQSLELDKETRKIYELFVYLREMRGFPYWWRDKPAEWTQKRKEALDDCVTDIVSED